MTYQQQQDNLKRIREAGIQLVGEELPKTYTVTKDKKTVTAALERETRARKRMLGKGWKKFMKKEGGD